LRAAKGVLDRRADCRPWRELAEIFTQKNRALRVHSRKEAVSIYRGEHGLLGVYKACEKFALGLGGDPEAKIRKFRESHGW
jgi:hypothetical protein